MSADNSKEAVDSRLFSRKKNLLTVQQYANSQGISTGVVQECAKLGVVQIRKHKNKTFIVDLPLDANKNARQQDDNKIELINTTEQAKKISEMVSKIFQPGLQINKPAITQTTAEIPDLKIFAQEENKAAAVKTEQFEPVPAEFKVTLGRKIFDAFQITTGSKIVLAVMSIAVVISIAAYFWTSFEKKAQQQKLQQAYANITTLINENDSANRKAKLYELDSANWKAEAQRSQNSIAGLEVELVQTKERLSQTQDDLSQIQQKHVNTLKQLNEQLQEITSRIQEVPKQ